MTAFYALLIGLAIGAVLGCTILRDWLDNTRRTPVKPEPELPRMWLEHIARPAVWRRNRG